MYINPIFAMIEIKSQDIITFNKNNHKYLLFFFGLSESTQTFFMYILNKSGV